jgi:hypothetical protein
MRLLGECIAPLVATRLTENPYLKCFPKKALFLWAYLPCFKIKIAGEIAIEEKPYEPMLEIFAKFTWQLFFIRS